MSYYTDLGNPLLLILAEFSGLCWLFGQQLFLPAYDTAVFPAIACKSQQKFPTKRRYKMNANMYSEINYIL